MLNIFVILSRFITKMSSKNNTENNSETIALLKFLNYDVFCSDNSKISLINIVGSIVIPTIICFVGMAIDHGAALHSSVSQLQNSDCTSNVPDRFRHFCLSSSLSFSTSVWISSLMQPHDRMTRTLPKTWWKKIGNLN